MAGPRRRDRPGRSLTDGPVHARSYAELRSVVRYSEPSALHRRLRLSDDALCVPAGRELVGLSPDVTAAARNLARRYDLVDCALLSKRRGCGGALADHGGRSRPGQDVDVDEGGHRDIHRVLPTPISSK